MPHYFRNADSWIFSHWFWSILCFSNWHTLQPYCTPSHSFINLLKTCIFWVNFISFGSPFHILGPKALRLLVTKFVWLGLWCSKSYGFLFERLRLADNLTMRRLTWKLYRQIRGKALRSSCIWYKWGWGT